MRIKVSRNNLLIVAASVLLAGCPKDIPVHTPMLPPLTSLPDPAPQAQLSSSISGDVTPVYTALLRDIDKTFEGDFTLEPGKDVHYRFIQCNNGENCNNGSADGPGFYVKDDQYTFFATYKGEVETKFFPGCHLRYVYPIPVLQFRPGILSQDGTWVAGVASHSFNVDFRGDSDFNCGGVPLLQRDVRQQISAAMNRIAGAKVEEAMKRTVFTAPQGEAWKGLAGPIVLKLKDATTNLCLYPSIQTITMTPFHANGNTAIASTAIRAYPKAVLQSSCPKAKIDPINLTTGAVTQEEHFNVPVALAVPYTTITNGLKDYFKQHSEIAVENHTINVVDAYAADASGNVLIAIKVTGWLKGTVYMWGTPDIAPDGVTLRIKDLKLDTETETVLDKLKLGLAKLITGNLASRVEPLARVDLKSRRDDIKESIDGDHDIKDERGKTIATMSLRSNRVTIERPYSKEEYLGAWVTVEGTKAAMAFKSVF